MFRLYLLAALLLTLITSCKKDTKNLKHHPAMSTITFADTEIKFNQRKSIDLNGDGKTDFRFETLLVGDPLQKVDKQQFYITSSIDNYLLVGTDETTPVLNFQHTISTNSSDQFNWFDIGAIVLAEKIISGDNEYYWQGNWKDAIRKYLPLQRKEGDLRYNGWIELSFNTTDEKIILHRAAVSLEAGKDIYAGVLP